MTKDELHKARESAALTLYNITKAYKEAKKWPITLALASLVMKIYLPPVGTGNLKQYYCQVKL